MKNLLEHEMIGNISNTIQKTNLFTKDEQFKKHLNFLDALIHRMESACEYINDNFQKCPETEGEIALYMYYSSNIVEIIKNAFDRFNLSNNPSNNCFTKTKKNILNRTIKEIKLNDDKIFRYLRSIVFAHPTDTSKSIPDRIEDEIQYCPFTLLDLDSSNYKQDCINIVINSNYSKDFILYVYFDELNEYIKNKFNLLEKLNGQLNKMIEKKISKCF